MTNSTTTILLGAFALVACSKSSAPNSNAAASASVTSYASAALPTASAAGTTASTPFEGEITITVTNESAQKLPAAITYAVKGDKIRYAPSATNVRAIDDQSAQQVYAIDDLAKSYEQVDTKSAKAQSNLTIDKTTKTEIIEGLSCDDWTIGAGDTKVDVCAAPGIAFYDLDRDAKSGAVEPSWAMALTKAKAFPLRAVVHDKSGKEQYRLQATTVARKKLDDAIFSVPPPSFKKMDLANDEKLIALP